MSETIIGIDLGTTNSEVAIVEQGKVKIIEQHHSKMVPSFVGVNEAGDILIGEHAKNQYLLYPERTIKSVKRLMGQSIQLTLGQQTYTPQEISAILLKHLKTLAENYLNQPVDKAVITVPAYFSDAQRQATREAGELAGLNVVRMINEPTAATLVYEVGQEEDKTVLVYDLGGGTFDVSVARIQQGVIEVLASHGDNQLGGDDFDQMIINKVVEHIQQIHNVEVSNNQRVMARIVRAAEQAKWELSNQPYVVIEEEYLLDSEDGPVHLAMELSRTDFEQMIEEAIDRTIDAVHIALKGAKISASDINEIILVGGSTRMPCIRERLFAVFGIEPHGEVDADLCVAMGAAIQAAMIGDQQVDKVLVDITPYTYGTSAIGHLQGSEYPFVFAPIIHKNSVLPCRQTDAFTTNYHGQPYVDIVIYQGEDADAKNNVKIGEFRVEGLQDVKAGNVILLTLDLDLNGILHVSAVEKATGLEKSITLQNTLQPIESGMVEAATQRMSSILGKLDASLYEQQEEAEDQNLNLSNIEATQALIDKAERLFDLVTEQDRQDMMAIISQLNACQTAKDIAGMEVATEQLHDMVFYLESSQ